MLFARSPVERLTVDAADATVPSELTDLEGLAAGVTFHTIKDIYRCMMQSYQ